MADDERIPARRAGIVLRAGLTETQVESLILKFLLARGDGTGREIADQVKLPFILVDEMLRDHEERSTGGAQAARRR